jgi:hypothetical protein
VLNVLLCWGTNLHAFGGKFFFWGQVFSDQFGRGCVRMYTLGVREGLCGAIHCGFEKSNVSF